MSQQDRHVHILSTQFVDKFGQKIDNIFRRMGRRILGSKNTLHIYINIKTRYILDQTSNISRLIY